MSNPNQGEMLQEYIKRMLLETEGKVSVGVIISSYNSFKNKK